MEGRGAGWPAVPGALRTAAVLGACLLVVGAAAYAVVYVLVKLAPLTFAILVALLLAALISPVSGFLRRHRTPSWLAALAGVLVLLAAVIGPLVLIGNQVVAQWPDLQQGLERGLDRVRDLLLNGPLPISENQLDSAVDGLTEAARGAAPDPMGGARTAAQAVASTLIAIVLLFFLLKDGTQMWRWSLRLAPERRRGTVDRVARAGWETLVAYVRGTVLIALVDAAGIGLALVILRVPLALPLTLLTFVAAFVPILGATVAGAVAILIAFVGGGLTDALLVLAAVLIVQQAEGNLLQPLIMGRALRLHPVVVLVAVTAGTLLAGIAGAVVAVPLTAVAYRVVQTVREGPDG